MAGASGATPLGEVAEAGPSRLAVLWFEVLSSLAVVAVGVAFATVGWDQFGGSGRAWVVALLVVGGGAAGAVVPLAGGGKHTAAALTAVVAVVTPTGFAYPVNT